MGLNLKRFLLGTYLGGAGTGAVIGSLQEGTEYVPQTGAYQLHEGEAVVPAHANPAAGGGGAEKGKLDAIVQQLLQAAKAKTMTPAQPQPAPGMGPEDTKQQGYMMGEQGSKAGEIGAAMNNFGVFVQNMVAQHKQNQIRDAAGTWGNLSRAMENAQAVVGPPPDGNPNNPEYRKKVADMMADDPWVKSNLNPANPKAMKHLKNMKKAFDVNLVGEEDGGENVYREGLKQHFKIQSALKKVKEVGGKLAGHKQQQAQQPPQGQQKATPEQQSQGLHGVIEQFMGQGKVQEPDPKQLGEAARIAVEHERNVQAARDKYQIMPDAQGNIIAVDRTNPDAPAKPIHTADGKQVTGSLKGKSGPMLVDGVPVGIFRNGEPRTPASPSWTAQDAKELAEYNAGHTKSEAEKTKRIEKARSAWIWGYLNSRMYPVMKGGALGMATGAEIKGAPFGTYGPATPEVAALRAHSTFDEIDVTFQGLGQAAKAAGDMAFTPEARAKLITALMDTSIGPKAAIEQFIGSKAAESMPEPLQDYAVWLASASESAYALRSIQGLGASSDMMRSAIKKMVPSAGTPTLHYFNSQMNAFTTEMKALKRGLPNIDMQQLDKLQPPSAAPGKTPKTAQDIPDAR